MSRLFVTERELKLFSDITKEFIKDIVGQEIVYYDIAEESTNKDSLYLESDKKIFYTPIKIECLVSWNEQTTTTTNFGVDRTYSIEVYIHQDDLNEKEIKISEGDFLEFAGITFEILSLDQPNLIYGMDEHKVMTKLICKSTRRSNFNILEPETGIKKIFTQVDNDKEQGDVRQLQVSGTIERIRKNKKITTPFTLEDNY